MQIKLLQVLQERSFSPVGSHKKNRFKGRVIAATNRSIHEIRNNGVFRDDFYYRLCSDIITVPPLRQRIQEDPGELDDLLVHILERMVDQSSEELKNEYGFELIPKVNSNYDAIVVAVAHKQYLKLDEDYFKSISGNNGILMDIKGVYRNKVNNLTYMSL